MFKASWHCQESSRTPTEQNVAAAWRCNNKLLTKHYLQQGRNDASWCPFNIKCLALGSNLCSQLWLAQTHLRAMAWPKYCTVMFYDFFIMLVSASFSFFCLKQAKEKGWKIINAARANNMKSNLWFSKKKRKENHGNVMKIKLKFKRAAIKKFNKCRKTWNINKKSK